MGLYSGVFQDSCLHSHFFWGGTFVAKEPIRSAPMNSILRSKRDTHFVYFRYYDNLAYHF